MKKLVSLFLWFCAATFLAQLCILGLAYSRGNVTRSTFVQIIALLNGIDIQGQRLKQVLISARNFPTPTYEDVLNAKVQASLELDSLSAAQERARQEIDAARRDLKTETDRFNKRVDAFHAEQKRIEEGSKANVLKETLQIFELMPTESAKTQLLKMLEKDQKSDVVAIIKGMAPDKQKKILAEFSQPLEQEKLAEIIAEIQNGTPTKTQFDSSKNGNPP